MPNLDEVVIIDVSKWQGVMDWEKAKPKIHAAYIKASEAVAGVDDQFQRNKAELTRLGIPWGAYHYFRPERDARKQAQHFASLIGGQTSGGSYQFESKLKPFLDVESRPIWITKQKMFDGVSKFIKEFKVITGEDVGIYTRASFWDDNLPRTDFGVHWLWVAMYNRTALEPLLPIDWGERRKTWKMWQWSADGNLKGAEYGATGSASIDLNRYKGGLAALNKDYGLDLKPIGDTAVEPPTKRTVTVHKTLAALNVRDNIIPSVKRGPTLGRSYSTSKILFTLPSGSNIEALEEIRDGENTWIRVGQRQYVAKLYDDVTFLN